MTLRCKCGGQLECVDGTGGEYGQIHEQYRCKECLRVGFYKQDPSGRSYCTGCVTKVDP